jgi:heme exporter protein C
MNAVFGRGLKTLSLITVVLLVGAFALVAFYAPNDADQGFIQKIFYLHVPLAIVALFGFVAGGVYGIKYLRGGDRLDDLRSYVAIHLSLILAVGALITGSIWARGSWGVWWTWDEPTLVSFLIVFLLYACYQPLRFSIEDSERQARYAAVFAVLLLGPSPFPALPGLLAILALADVGIAVVGTLVGAMAIQTRARDLIVPLISLPLILPVVIAAGHATAPLFAEAGAEALPARWLGVLGLYDLVFGLLAYAIFDFLLEE